MIKDLIAAVKALILLLVCVGFALSAIYVACQHPDVLLYLGVLTVLSVFLTYIWYAFFLMFRQNG